MVYMKDPTEISAEEDEEQMIMRRLRNSVDELKRGYRWLDYRMQRVKDKADKSKEKRESIELPEDKLSIRGEPIPFKAYIPMEEVIQYRKDQKSGGSRLIYKVTKHSKIFYASQIFFRDVGSTTGLYITLDQQLVRSERKSLG